jgi:hypothetical protein
MKPETKNLKPLFIPLLPAAAQQNDCMAARNIYYYLIKLGRLSGWLLLIMVLTYITTGYAMTSEFHLDQLIDVQAARAIHLSFGRVVLVIFLVHAAISVYFALKRWGWIQRRPKPSPQAQETAQSR